MSSLLTACHSLPLAGDPTGEVTRETDAREPEALWEIDWWVRLVTPDLWEFSPRELAEPAVDPDTQRIIVETRDGYVRSLSPVDGKTEWQFKTHGPFNAGALIDHGVVYVPGADGTLYALKAETGQEIWHYNSGEELATTPVLSAGKLLVASQTDTLFAVEPATGKWLWQYRRDQPNGFTIRGAAGPRVDGGTAYIGFSDGYVVALNTADGSMKWEKALSGQAGQFLDVDSTPALDDTGRLYVASYKEGVFALDPSTGEVQWHTAKPGITHVVEKGQVLFVAGDAQLGAISAADGKNLWSVDLGQKSGRPPLFARGMMIVPINSALSFVDPSTGHVRTNWNPGKGVSATPARSQNRVYVLSNLGSVYALRLLGKGG